MTAPAFTLPTEEEEYDELSILIGGFTLTDSTSDAQLDAIASDICRHLGKLLADRARYEEAERAEKRRIDMFYTSRFEKLDMRIAELQSLGAEVARRAEFPGKSKSRSVAFGSYGRRKQPERVTVADNERAIVSIAKIAPHLIHSKPSILVSEVKPIVLAALKASGELLDGFEHVPESETFFVKPEGN